MQSDLGSTLFATSFQIPAKQTELFTKRQNFRPSPNSKHLQTTTYWFPAFSPFLTMFSKAFFSRGVKSWDCVVKGKN